LKKKSDFSVKPKNPLKLNKQNWILQAYNWIEKINQKGKKPEIQGIDPWQIAKQG
jgi:hypothetical protein